MKLNTWMILISSVLNKEVKIWLQNLVKGNVIQGEEYDMSFIDNRNKIYIYMIS